jgi:hydrogenase expression/formation protein HypC
MCLAVPGRVLAISEGPPLQRTAKVDFAGIRKEVSLACLPEAKPGDYVLVHVGIAISVIDESEARRVFDYLDGIEAEEGASSPSEARQP